jgi:hypothetical protein
VGVVRDEGGPRSEAAASEVGTLPPGLEFAISSRRLTLPRARRYRARERPLGATFVDSTALHVLIRAARQLDGTEGELIVAAPDPNVRRVFGITGFDRLFSIVSSLSDVSVLS